MHIDSDILAPRQCYTPPTLCLGFAVVDSLCTFVKTVFNNFFNKNVMSMHAHMGDVSSHT